MNPRQINIDQFDYPLPDERIAKFPLAERDRCRLLVNRADGRISTHFFSEVPDLLPPDATLIYNNTRVINARLRFRKESGALIEVFCLEPKAPADYAQSFASEDAVEWLCFVGNSKRWKTGELRATVNVGGSECILTAERIAKNEKDSVVRLSWTGRHTFAEIIAAAGELPIPPYLNRSTEQSDNTDYQTVFSRVDGSVAAPTAGLHFTPSLLAEIDRRGICRREITLHVGA
ncbi:MAG: S-adenosylmethionine:tRNA ribosyltransferase-isomerase, partial [Muribaculaceae bacterium]|nr:S-adenosylmethionine:tRNA ribosyltransferase-isomerase [Muribaculaceae bacterium]